MEWVYNNKCKYYQYRIITQEAKFVKYMCKIALVAGSAEKVKDLLTIKLNLALFIEQTSITRYSWMRYSIKRTYRVSERNDNIFSLRNDVTIQNH